MTNFSLTIPLQMCTDYLMNHSKAFLVYNCNKISEYRLIFFSFDWFSIFWRFFEVSNYIKLHLLHHSKTLFNINFLWISIECACWVLRAACAGRLRPYKYTEHHYGTVNGCFSYGGWSCTKNYLERLANHDTNAKSSVGQVLLKRLSSPVLLANIQMPKAFGPNMIKYRRHVRLKINLRDGHLILFAFGTVVLLSLSK